MCVWTLQEIRITLVWLSPTSYEQVRNNIGVAIAYLLRAGKRPNNPKAQDLRKAIHHLEIELQYEETFNPTPQTTEDRKS